MGVSHDRNTLGPPDHPGISPIAKGKPLPKRDGAWECAGGEEYYSGPQPGLNIILPFTGLFNYSYRRFYHRSNTRMIRTPACTRNSQTNGAQSESQTTLCITLHIDNGRGTMFIRLVWSNINEKCHEEVVWWGGLRRNKHSRLGSKLTSMARQAVHD